MKRKARKEKRTTTRRCKWHAWKGGGASRSEGSSAVGRLLSFARALLELCLSFALALLELRFSFALALLELRSSFA